MRDAWSPHNRGIISRQVYESMNGGMIFSPLRTYDHCIIVLTNSLNCSTQ